MPAITRSQLLSIFHVLLAMGLSSLKAFAADSVESTNVSFSLPDDSLMLAGRFVFERNCIVCHGRFGDGKGEMAPTLIPKPRPFTSGIFKYRTTPAGALPTNDDLAHVVREGVANTSMPAFSHLSDRDIRAVTEYLKAFSRKWRKPENYAAPMKLPPLPPWFTNADQLKPHAARGRELFSQACVACHGENGDGKGATAETLRDAWDELCHPADLRSPVLRSGRDIEVVYRVLITGISGTPMPSYAESLTEEQRWSIVAYIQTLRQAK